MKLSTHGQFPILNLTTFTGEKITVPSSGNAFTHIQFRRFADCPICNLHLRHFTTQREKLDDAGIHEVIFFHSTTEELKRYQDHLPFDCIADPNRTYYRRFDVEPSWRALLSWQALGSALKEVFRSKRWWREASQGLNGLPADILLNSSGLIVAVKYGIHADDQWSIDDVIHLSQSIEVTQPSQVHL